jgi:hypothetical protein
VRLLGIEIVPVTPAGAGLMPGEAISVEPSGMPVWETPEPVPMPSGDVAPMVGVGLAIPLTCALAALQTTRTASIAVINENFIGFFRLPTALPARARVDHFCDENQQRQMFSFLSSASSRFCCFASKVDSFSCSALLAAECGEKSPARG